MDDRLRCDRCGRFISTNAPGVSWSRQYTGYELHDQTWRCSPCTDEHGVKPSNCNPLCGPWNGRNPQPEAERG